MSQSIQSFQSTQRAIREQESNQQTSSYRRSLRYFVLFHQAFVWIKQQHICIFEDFDVNLMAVIPDRQTQSWGHIGEDASKVYKLNN